jgi:hypothetical protein
VSRLTLQIAVDTYVGGALAIGMMIPITIAALGAGYILGTFVCDRFNKTVLGIHLRHFLTRKAPSKFFTRDFYGDYDRD